MLNLTQIFLPIYLFLVYKAHVVLFKHSKIWGKLYFCVVDGETVKTDLISNSVSIINYQYCVTLGDCFSFLSLRVLSVKQGSITSELMQQLHEMFAKHLMLYLTQTEHLNRWQLLSLGYDRYYNYDYLVGFWYRSCTPNPIFFHLSQSHSLKQHCNLPLCRWKAQS